MGMRSAVGLVFLASACGMGGGGGGSGGSGLTGTLQLVAHDPVDAAVQVMPDSSIVLRFDEPVVAACLQDPSTWLGVGDSTDPIPGTFSQADGGREVIFTPAVPLQPETEYTFHLSPMTCDWGGRILEQRAEFTFRSLDERAPTVTGATAPLGIHGDLVIAFDEPVLPETVDQDSVILRDGFGTVHPLALTVAGAQVVADPVVDLPGETSFVLEVLGGVDGVCDRAGNALSGSWSSGFTTATDAQPPLPVSTWPQAIGSASPLIQPVIVFDESVDPSSLQPASIRFVDQDAVLVPFSMQVTPDQKALRLQPTQPLVSGGDYTVAFMSGSIGIRDMSGNELAVPSVMSFTVGNDGTPPVVVSSFPTAGATRVSPNVAPVIGFSEPLDRHWVDTVRVTLERDGSAVPTSLVLDSGDSQIRVLPAALLEAGAEYTLRVRGGYDGLRDLPGNLLAADLPLTFTVSDDPTLPGLIMSPGDGNSVVPSGVRATVVFDSPVDPLTVTESTVFATAAGIFVPGDITLSRRDRVVTFVPSAGWNPDVWYTLHLRGGPNGIRELSGNWLAEDATSRFRIGTGADTIAPLVAVTLNNTDEARRQGMAVPPTGFSIDVHVFDPIDLSVDMSSVDVEISGAEVVPDADRIFELAEVGLNSLTYTFADAEALAPGQYELRVSAADLSGNQAWSDTVSFRVQEPRPSILPFERTQIVWARFDLDRDGNGRADFEDDLELIGFTTAGDPAGTNEYMLEVLRDGVVAQASGLFGRDPQGAPLDGDSVSIRLTDREPLGVPHMQISVGGFDPQGSRGRGYGDDSSGILGRAVFDHRNSSPRERNISKSPGLGVFPAEMFLFQSNIHRQIYPAFLTHFAKRFIKLVPEMGGVPAGSHPLDGRVLAPGFDFVNATNGERARFLNVFDAADDWATAIGVILAHEIGHSTGLVSPGPNPSGLHGDRSLHNDDGSATDVMASALSYTTMVLQPYSFRDVNIAYLRQRLLVR